MEQPKPEYAFPWGRFLLLWALAVLMGGSLLWLHKGFSISWWAHMAVLLLAFPPGLAWAVTRPRWRKVSCSWCGAWGRSLQVKEEHPFPGGGTEVMYTCSKCGKDMTRLRKTG